MSLKIYKAKRNFRQTKEPAPKPHRAGSSGRPAFVIQKHAASHLHYDFRLEMDGVLKSWAVPKGFPVKRGDRRLAVEVEDHPLEYGSFEGTIPEGNYGAGTVMVWDRGTYAVWGDNPLLALQNGKIHFLLRGKKLQGEWTLVRMRRFQGSKPQWLLLKSGSDIGPLSRSQEDRSALSGRAMAQIAAAGNGHEWESNRTTGLARSDRAGAVAPRVMRRSASPAGETRRRPQRPTSGKGAGKKTRSGLSKMSVLQNYQKAGRTKPPLLYYVFDAVECEGKDLMGLPLWQRKNLVQQLVKDAGPTVRFSASIQTDSQRLMKEMQARGLEGLIAKRKESHYEPGRRSGAWVKYKWTNEQEFVIGGYTRPKGARSHFGAILVGYYDKGRLLFAAKVGTGFNEQTLAFLYNEFQRLAEPECPFANLPEQFQGSSSGLSAAEMKRCSWVRPELVCQVRFAEWTRDQHLRQPAFLGLREDKDPREVVREKPK